MSEKRINTRLNNLLYEYVKRVTGPDGLYETPSEYVRDLIRRDMRAGSPEAPDALDFSGMPEPANLAEHIKEGFRDFAEGRFIVGTGDLQDDLRRMREKRANGWK
ncbi:CopG family transcriptional regulator [Minwuia sp.]|uniref:CopG family transcriptional regulator n=1 Tax=Minwuia sp. TaxID=2493630 RepID=UPI003A900F74